MPRIAHAHTCMHTESVLVLVLVLMPVFVLVRVLAFAN